MNTLYTYGYGGKGNIRDLKTWATSLGARILDVRIQPWSARSEWCREELLAHFGSLNYRHDRRLGNYARGSGQVRLVEPVGGINDLLTDLQERPVILLCGCSRPDLCHRMAIAEMVSQRVPDICIVVHHIRPGEPPPEPEWEPREGGRLSMPNPEL